VANKCLSGAVAMLIGWGGNCRSGITLATHHRLWGVSTLSIDGLSRVGFLPWQKVSLPGQWEKLLKTGKIWQKLAIILHSLFYSCNCAAKSQYHRILTDLDK